MNYDGIIETIFSIYFLYQLEKFNTFRTNKDRKERQKVDRHSYKSPAAGEFEQDGLGDTAQFQKELDSMSEAEVNGMFEQMLVSGGAFWGGWGGGSFCSIFWYLC